MQILQLGKFYSPFHGGMETVLKVLSEGLVRRGYGVEVLCAGSKKTEIEWINGVQVRRIHSPLTLFSQPIMAGLQNELRIAIERSDLIHMHSPNPLMEKALLAVNSKKPIVVTYHSDVIRQKILAPFYSKIIDALLSRSDSIILSSHEYLNTSQIIQPFRHKADVIPIGVHTPGQILGENELRFRELIQNRFGRFALFVGRIVPYKGIRFLIQSMQMVDMNLVVVGDGSERSRLMRLCQRLGVNPKVHWIGSVASKEELNAYYSACEFFVLPSVERTEAFGVSLLEAMSFGKPMISTDLNTGVQSVNFHEETGLVVPRKDPKALAEAMKKLMEDASLRLRYSQAASENFKNNFTSDLMISRHTKLYHRFIQETKNVKVRRPFRELERGI